MGNFVLRWVINAIALWITTLLVPGIVVEGPWWVLALAALIIGLVNALIRPALKLLTCPLIILTLGLFTLVINALMLLLASWIARQLSLSFYVQDFWAALLGGLVLSIVSAALSLVLGERKERRS
jgi:putative membrane protein